MSKKQELIINGIDVSECSYYNKDNEPYCCEVWDNECEAQNCYFKQFKRLQEENEKLLLGKGALIEFCNKLTKIIDKKKENENKILQILSCANCDEKYLSPDCAELYEKNVQLQKENEELKKKKDEYYLINLDYETKISYLIQTLEEIRNIAETPIITDKNRFDEITNKINEVLNK